MKYTEGISNLKKLIKEGNRILDKFNKSKGTKSPEIVKQMNMLQKRVTEYELQLGMMEDTMDTMHKFGATDIQLGGKI